MLIETNPKMEAESAANVNHEEASKAAQSVVVASKEAARAALGRPNFTPIYVEHKKKVPLATFELNTAGLNPLARKGLERLPRSNGVPVIRAIGKDDDWGFSFIFRIDPSELTCAGLAGMLERWNEKYEIAKAKAGLTPKPVEPAGPLVPRSPRRKMEILPGQELDEQIQGVEVMSGGVLLELICAFALSQTEFAFLSKFALGAAAILMAITINLVHTIYKDLKTNPLW